MRNRTLSLLVLLAGVCAGGMAHANVVGRTPGTYTVSADGAATYTIQIWAQKGPNGLEPHLALAYNSQSGNGYVGVGWALAGLSAITRCGKTYAQDGQASPVQLQTSDGYCLDGQRLRLVSGTDGAAGSTYQTEIANFSLVTAESSAGNGPSYWEVQGKDGLTYEYGNGGNSQVLAAGTSTAWQWWLDKVTDRAGNTLTISYSTTNATSAVVPSDVDWTPTAQGATTYAYDMHFSYGTNAPQSSVEDYVAGSAISNTNLLQSIAINYNGSLVKEYFLTYQQSSNTGKKELAKVTECADSAQSNCLAPTAFTYNQDSQGIGVSSSSTPVSLGGTANWYLTGYDLTGDGYRDLLYQVGTTWYVAFGTASGYSAPINTGISTPQYAAGQPTLLAGDLLGNGQDGLLANHNGTWYYYTWDGSTFVGSSTGLAYNSSATAFALADTSGNGKPNLVELVVDSSGNPDVYIVPNTSSGGTPSFGAAVLAYTNTAGSGLTFVSAGLRGPDSQHDAPITHLDFDGDGTDDLVLHMKWYTINDVNGKNVKVYIPAAYQLLAHGTTFTGTSFAYNITYYFLNWNDSKCTDSIDGATLYVAACNGAAAATYTLPGTAVAAIDWDGSGRDDVLYDSGGYLYVQPTTGTGLGTPYSTGIPYNSSAQYAATDIIGDGLDDLLTWNGSSFTYNMHVGQGGQPIDTLSEVLDGYGNWVKPAYVNLLQGGATYTTNSLIPSGSERFYGPLYIVAQSTDSDPSNPPNASYTRTYYYQNAMMSLVGYGFEGFGKRQIEDSRNGLWQKIEYQQVFPYIGFITYASLAQSQGSGLVSSLNNSIADIVLDSAQYNERYFPYVSQSILYQYEVGGSESTDQITTTAKTYTYDNDGNATSIVTQVTDNDPGSPYTGSSWTTTVSNTPDENAGTWCLTLLSSSQVSYTTTYTSGPTGEGAPVTITKQYTPDTTNCRYNQIVTQPGTSYQVTEVLQYDGFGNINTDTITGLNMPARETQASWGTTGQFPMSVTDPTGANAQLNYDFRYGTVSGFIDPNGEQTAWQYNDGFGRVTQETRPDGTYTTWSYSPYSGTDALPRMVITEQPHDTANHVINTMTEELDMQDRPYLEQKDLINDNAATVMQRNYDSLGRVVAEQAPYQGNTVGATTYSYDVLNRVTQMQRPISQGSGTLATTTYQYAGRSTTVTDPNGNTRILVHDVNGWLRHTTDGAGYTVITGYDAAGSRRSVTDSQGNTLWTGNWAYGVAPFLIGETSMDRGLWTYTLDALGERTAWTDAKGQSFSATYDVLSRPLTRSEPDFFTQWTWGSTPTSHNVGKLQAVCTGTGANPTSCGSSGESESWSYDSLGRLYQRAISLPSVNTYTYTWQYDATTGFLNSLTYPAGSNGQALTLQYGYAYGYLQTVTDTLDSPNIVVWQANTMNPAGQITTDTLGNGVVTTRAFDAVTHFLDSIQAGVGGGTALQNNAYLFDADGNLAQRQDNNLGLTENFYYDADNRLSYSRLNNTQNLSLSYDAMGNITARSDIAGDAPWTYDPVHKHEVTQAGSSAYTYTYDANGNMTGRNGYAIYWTSYNYPSGINSSGESITFSYGPFRQRWMAQYSGPSGTETTYTAGKLFEEVVGGGATDYRNYIFAGNDLVAVDNRSSTGTNTLTYVLSDHQGSFAHLVTSAGTNDVTESFTAYGNRRSGSTWSGPPSGSDETAINAVSRWGYTGATMLGVSMGLNDLNGRVEDAIIGRFLSADPYIPDPEDPQSFNRYSYVNNNPLTYVDPSGFDSQNSNGHGGNEPCSAVAQDGCGNPSGQGLQQLPTIPVNGSRLPSGISNTSTPSISPGSGSGGTEAGGGRGTGAPSKPAKSNQKSCVSPAGRVAQGLVGAGEATGGLVQAIIGAADILFSVAGAPETFGASVLGITPGAANLTMGSVTLGDGLLLLNAAFTGSGNAPTLEGLIGQAYGGETGGKVGDLVGVGGQVASAALSAAGTAEAAAANAATMALSNVLSNAGTVCGQ